MGLPHAKKMIQDYQAKLFETNFIKKGGKTLN